MTIARIADMGTTVAQAAIDTAAAAGGDRDTLLLRVGVLEFLKAHAEPLTATGDDARLLDAYRSWLEVAIVIYSTGDEDLVAEYTRRAEALQALMDDAAARAGDAASS